MFTPPKVSSKFDHNCPSYRGNKRQTDKGKHITSLSEVIVTVCICFLITTITGLVSSARASHPTLHHQWFLLLTITVVYSFTT